MTVSASPAPRVFFAALVLLLAALAVVAVRARSHPPSLAAEAEVQKHNIGDLLLLEDDFEVCDGVYCRLSDADPDGPRPGSGVDAVIVLSYEAGGLITNGGFKFLLEAQQFFDRDPGYARTLAAFRAIGEPGTVAAWEQAMAWFPGGAPTDPEERLRRLLQTPTQEVDRVNALYWDSRDAYQGALARYIRAHREEIESLLRSGRRRSG